MSVGVALVLGVDTELVGAMAAGAVCVEDFRTTGVETIVVSGAAVVARPRVSASIFGEGTAAMVPANTFGAAITIVSKREVSRFIFSLMATFKIYITQLS